MHRLLQTAITTLQKLEPALRSFAASRGYFDDDEFYQIVWSRCIQYFERGNAHTRQIEALIWRIAHGKLFDFYRSQSRRPCICQLQLDPGVAPSETPTNRQIDRLKSALSELPIRARKAFCWKYGHDWTDQEIADALKITKAAVRTLNYRTKNRLSKGLRND